MVYKRAETAYQENLRIRHAEEAAMGDTEVLNRLKPIVEKDFHLRKIATKSVMEWPLDPAEQRAYDALPHATKADFQTAIEGMKKTFKEARDKGFIQSDNLNELYSTRRRPFAELFLGRLPATDRAGAAPASLLRGANGRFTKSFERQLFHADDVPDSNFVDDYRRYVKGIVEKQFKDPERTQVEGEIVKLMDSPEAPYRQGEIDIAKRFKEGNIESKPAGLDREEFLRRNRETANSTVTIGDVFDYKGVHKPLVPYSPTGAPAKLRVGPFDPNTQRYKLEAMDSASGEWKPARGEWTESEIHGLKNEATLSQQSRFSQVAHWVNTLGAWSWLALKPISFPVAGISNLARTLSSESRGRFFEAVGDVAENMMNKELRGPWLRKMEALGITTTEMQRYLNNLEKPTLGQRLEQAAFATLSVPDLLQKPVLHRMIELDMLKEHGPGTESNWSVNKVAHRAAVEAATMSDLSGSPYNPSLSNGPVGSLIYFLQKSSLRMTNLAAQYVANKNWKRLAILTGVPVGAWGAIYHLSGEPHDSAAERTKFVEGVFRRAADFGPFLYMMRGIPGYSAVEGVVKPEIDRSGHWHAPKTLGQWMKSGKRTAQRLGLAEGE